MSINDIIATSSVHAFNSGVLSGRDIEQKRIARIMAEISMPYESDIANEQGEVVFVKDLMSYMTDKDYE
jgi:hypothetical protein|tara:strand:+ start:117 stop:323 length:207 start_codon:yes stop_codon:yes gene_type:complete